MENFDEGMQETLITLTSDIVAAYVSNNNVEASEVASLVTNIHGALSGLRHSEEPVEVLPDPAVSIRTSVKKDHIVCLDCGKKMKMLKRHLMTEHDLSIDEYRERWSLAPDYPMVAPDYAETRRDLAKKIGLGRKLGQKRGRKKKVV